MGTLDGKVAIITGAANGLGRSHALELARQGARIVVNDLGTTADGKGRDESAARAVVEEIEKLGGEAVPHFGDVANWNDAQALIKTAIDAFGDLNVLICNAGFTRDSVIFNMTEEDFDNVVRVHLKGHFAPMKFASIYWRERSKAVGGPVHARVISTASESFLYGTPGQPNYAAAKAGIVALTLATARGLERYGVRANAICPRARTAMTAQVFGAAPEDGLDPLSPEHVAPLVVYLASPAAQTVSGQVFVVHGGMVALLAAPVVERRFDADLWTPAALAEQVGGYFADRDPTLSFAANDILKLGQEAR